MPILVGIDGSGSAIIPGPGRDKEYDKAFADSFVSRLCKNRPNAQYNRGPVAGGGGLNDAINRGFDFIVQKRKTLGNEEPILLTGFSRGGLGVLVIARKLQSKKINVQAALLFDAVDKYLFKNAEEIPNNVGFVHHVIRDPLTSSRESFGNAGLSYRPPTVYPHAFTFKCTHGGMGGTPWNIPAGKKGTDLIDEGFPDGMTKVTYDDDKRISGDVWTFCQPFIRLHKFM